MTTNSIGAASGAPAERPSNQVLLGDETGKDMFLQLLVAQIRNQDPLSPLDPTDFVSQLAQFSSLEQLLKMGKSLESIEALLSLDVGPAETADAEAA